ncbi:hypothetical protein MXD58_021985, partial [Frankia sp. AgKG'84/4]|nr:hypothetical protein [Frankia sp. AgKG'84/4]
GTANTSPIDTRTDRRLGGLAVNGPLGHPDDQGGPDPRIRPGPADARLGSPGPHPDHHLHTRHRAAPPHRRTAAPPHRRGAAPLASDRAVLALG